MVATGSIPTLYKDAEDKMKRAVSTLTREFAEVRGGRRLRDPGAASDTATSAVMAPLDHPWIATRSWTTSLRWRR